MCMDEEKTDIEIPDVENGLNELSEEEQSAAEEFAYKLIKQAASLKAVKINREKYLRAELKKFCPGVDADLAIAESPSAAGVTAREMDAIALSAIDVETKKCAGLSFLAGIPGGIAMAGTIPADLAQYFCHVMRVEQKLAYIYGWQSFLDDNDEVDDETIMKLVVLMGVMLQVGTAANAINSFAKAIAQKGVQKAIQKQALTKTFFYPSMKAVLRVLGVQLTKETFAKTVSKAVPVVGGVVSGGVTYAAFKPASEKLRRYLRALPTSGISEDEPDYKKKGAIADAAKALSPVADGVSNAVGVVGKSAQKAASAAGNALSDGAKAVGGFLDSLGKRS